MLDPILEIWVRGIQQKIARLDPMFRTYVDHLARQPVTTSNYHESILDEEDEEAGLPTRDIINQLQGVDTQLTLLLSVFDVGDPPPQVATSNTLGNLLGTLKSILPVKQMVAMWFQTEMLTDPDSIYYSPNFGPDVWLDHDKKNGPTNSDIHSQALKVNNI